MQLRSIGQESQKGGDKTIPVRREPWLRPLAERPPTAPGTPNLQRGPSLPRGVSKSGAKTLSLTEDTALSLLCVQIAPNGTQFINMK